MKHESTVHITLNPIIAQLKEMEIDGETMEWIIRELGMEEQMLRQLMLNMPTEQVEYLIEEREMMN